MSKKALIDKEMINFIRVKDNVASLTHGLTHLQFALNSPNKADIFKCKTSFFVKSCFTHHGRFQVIIATNVSDYYQVVIQKLDISEESKVQTKWPLKIGVIGNKLCMLKPETSYFDVIVTYCLLLYLLKIEI